MQTSGAPADSPPETGSVSVFRRTGIMVRTNPFVTHLLNHGSVRIDNDPERWHRSSSVAPWTDLLARPATARPATLHGDDGQRRLSPGCGGSTPPSCTDYLAAENDWTAQRTAHLADLRQAIFDELAGVLPDDDVSAPWRDGAFDYRVRRRAGEQYRVHVRTAAADAGRRRRRCCWTRTSSPRGTTTSTSGSARSSPDGRLLAYSVDHDGDEVFTLRVRDLATGEDLPDELLGTYYGLAWAADSNSFFYTTARRGLPPGPGAPARARHDRSTATRSSGTSSTGSFELEIDATRSGEFVVLRRLQPRHDRDAPGADGRSGARPVVVQPREQGREYHLDHQRGPDGGRLLLVVDDAGPRVPPGRAAGRARRRRRPAGALARGPAAPSRRAGRRRRCVRRPRRGHRAGQRRSASCGCSTRAGRRCAWCGPTAPARTSQLGRNEEYDVAAVRLVREGWVRPTTDVDHSLADGHEALVHAQQVLRGLDDYAVREVEVARRRRD